MTTAFSEMVGLELERPAPDAAKAISASILARHGDAVAAILFYGSMLRTENDGSLLDLYVLTESLVDFHQDRILAAANAVLPPNVSYWEAPGADGVVRAKVAVMSVGSFARRARGRGIDTTIWARFCQPACLVYARNEGVRRIVVAAVTDCVRTAAHWARRLNPEEVLSERLWTGLFAHTYGAELRAERSGRAVSIYAFASERYDRVLALGEDQGTARRRNPTLLGWPVLRVLGKLLNLARLAKAAFTFRNGVEYILWKIERHSGRPVPISAWERRHPFLAAPGLLWRLYRAGMIR